MCQSVQRMRLSHRGFIVQDAGEPLFYRDAKWSTECVVEILGIPDDTTVQALSLAIMKAGGVEIFKERQSVSFEWLQEQ